MMQAIRAIASPPRLVARGALVLSMTAMLWGGGASNASAQDGVIAGGLLGAGAGAIIGGATGGGKGAAKGAIIGGVAGAVIGGATERNKKRYAPPPRGAAYYAPAPGPAYGLVYDVQTSLYRLGYDPGPIDGRYGPRTGQAIAAYESDNGLLVTGEPSEALLNHMIQRGG